MRNDELIINGIQIELSDTTEFSFNFSVADVKDPSKRSRDVSKVLKIEGTQNNLRAFYSAYQLSQYYDEANPVGFDFDPRISYDAQYYVNGILRFNGAAQILKTKINDGVIHFDLVLFSNIVNLINQFGEITLPELGWSEYNHILNHTNQSNSWSTSVIKNGVATNNFTAGVPNGFGYYWALIDYGHGGANDEFEDNKLFPYIYFREAFTKAFDLLGYTITGSFIDKEVFKRCVLGMGGGELPSLSDIDKLNRLVDATISRTLNGNINLLSTSTELVFSQTIPFYLASSGVTIISDPQSKYSAASGLITIANDGNYKYSAVGDIDYEIEITGVDPATVTKVNFLVYTLKNGGTQKQTNYIGDITPMVGNTLNGTISINEVTDIPLGAGDTLRIYILASVVAEQENNGGTGICLYDFTVDPAFSYKVESLDGEVQNSDTVVLSNYVPKLKVNDFVNSVIKQFNLYVSEPNESNEVLIETLEDYYESVGVADDWSAKQDLTKEIEIEPIALTQPKRYLYKYAEDKDYYHSVYRDRYGLSYGDLNFDNPTFFTKGDNVIQLPYTVSPPVEIENTDLIIPVVYESTNGVVKPIKGKPRCGLINSLQTGAFTLLNSGGGSNTTYASYPLLHTIDNISTPTIDLCFSTPIEVFYTATAYTTNTIFNEFSRKFINELTSIDGKLLKTYIKLDEGDFYNDYFSVPKRIKGVAYRLNLISDTVLNSGKTSLVELIKILDSDTPRNYTITPPKLVDAQIPERIPIVDEDSGDISEITLKNGVLQIEEDSGKIVKSVNGYKYIIEATATQTGTNPITATGLGINTFPMALVNSYVGVGTYRTVGTGAFNGVVIGHITNGDLASGDSVTFEIFKVDNVTI